MKRKLEIFEEVALFWLATFWSGLLGRPGISVCLQKALIVSTVFTIRSCRRWKTPWSMSKAGPVANAEALAETGAEADAKDTRNS